MLCRKGETGTDECAWALTWENINIILIIIMYIYHAFIKTLSAHMTHVNLNMTFYTHSDFLRTAL